MSINKLYISTAEETEAASEVLLDAFTQFDEAEVPYMHLHCNISNAWIIWRLMFYIFF